MTGQRRRTVVADASVLTVEQADADRELLSKRRFRMPFESFRDLLPKQDGEEVS